MPICAIALVGSMDSFFKLSAAGSSVHYSSLVTPNGESNGRGNGKSRRRWVYSQMLKGCCNVGAEMISDIV